MSENVTVLPTPKPSFMKRYYVKNVVVIALVAASAVVLARSTMKDQLTELVAETTEA